MNHIPVVRVTLDGDTYNRLMAAYHEREDLALELDQAQDEVRLLRAAEESGRVRGEGERGRYKTALEKIREITAGTVVLPWHDNKDEALAKRSEIFDLAYWAIDPRRD